jgi:hypothetical protein
MLYNQLGKMNVVSTTVKKYFIILHSLLDIGHSIADEYIYLFIAAFINAYNKVCKPETINIKEGL